MNRGAESAGAGPASEGLPRPRGPEDRDALLQQADAVAHLPVVHRHLLGPVPGADHEVDPAAAHQVEDGEVLGEADRVVQGQDERGDQHAQLAGPPGDGGGHHQRRGAVPVVGSVVLRQRHHGEAVVLGPGALLERRPVQGRGRRPERRCPQVVAQREPDTRVVAHVPLFPPTK
jgi:hypothetical protein